MTRGPRNADVDERILVAATDLFAADGYANVTVPQVAARARVGLNTIYLRYPSKEALGNAVFRRCKSAWAAATLDRWPAGSPEAQFRFYWRELCAFAERERSMALYNERNPVGHAYDAESKALRETLDRRSERALQGWIESKETAALPFEVMAALIHGSFQKIIELPVSRKRRQALLAQAEEAVWCALSAKSRRASPARRSPADEAAA